MYSKSTYFLWFVLVVFVGTALRSFFVFHLSIPLDFQNLVHSHSHTAFFAWVMTSLPYLYLHYFPFKEELKSKFNLYIIFTHILSLLAIIAFAVSGYNFFSILLSVLFVFNWYFLIYIFYKYVEFKDRINKIPLYFLGISTLATWLLPILIITNNNEGLFKDLSINFFLNNFAEAWLIGSILVLMQIRKEINFNNLTFYTYIILSFILTLKASILSFNDEVVLLIKILSFIFGLLHIVLYIQMDKKNYILKILGFLLLVKGVIEMAIIIPELVDLANNRIFIITYLHIKLLGFSSIYLIYNLFENKNLKELIVPILFFLLMLIIQSLTQLISYFDLFTINNYWFEFIHIVIFISSVLVLLSALKFYLNNR